jgi:hypothetical protein
MKEKIEPSREGVDRGEIKIEGRVSSVGLGDDGLALLVILDKGGVSREAKFPFVKNPLALDALNACLSNQNVRYVDIYERWCHTDRDTGSSNDYKLEILEGPLQGKTYTAEQSS